MSRTAVRATAALLCGVVLVALGLAFVGLPESERAPESLRVDVGFDTFQPGITQIRTSPIEVPVPSRVLEARVDAAGTAMNVDVALTICGPHDCRPLDEGTELDPGPYLLQVQATLGEQADPGGTGEFSGEIRIVETRESPMVDTSVLMSVAGIGLLAVAFGALAVRRRQEATT